MNKILIFDLDDTLYPEITYVQSGFRAVSDWLEAQYGWLSNDTYHYLMQTLEAQGRGMVFNTFLHSKNRLSQQLVKQCLKIYRHHQPNISLAPEALQFLQRWQAPLYLVTDGHKIVQHNKIQALGLSPYFTKTYITHRYGVTNAKPALHCFELIRRQQQCSFQDLIYVGDNPTKDFVNLNKQGSTTVRVLTGEHRQVQAATGYDAQHHINHLGELLKLLTQLEG
ncbi:MAG: HAD family hydrolase [Venatoribacter sp.]